jgi:hypothetical protein
MSFQFSKWKILPAGVLLLGTVAVGQDASSTGSSTQGTTTTAPAPKPTIAQRKENQQDRIANGVQSGQLTAGETSKLETKEAAINGETRADRAANGGKLTAAEKQQVNKQQNQLSKQIYNDKHNANTATYGNNEVGARRDLQQQRIANGIRSGQMSPSEAAKAEGHEQSINKNIAADRQANGGKLTPQERKNINQRQNNASRQIYNEKHNEKTAPR